MASSYYHRKEWRAFRERCLARVNYKCERCEKPGILQVHHPEYAAGRKPWEYEVEFCEVLCRGCHAGEHGIILPREGWTIIYSDLDNNEPSDPVPCANCGLSVTWHFVIYHPEWGEAIVGSECAENLSLGEDVMQCKSLARRLRTFLRSPRWRETPHGWTIQQSGTRILVYRRDDHFRLKIEELWGKLDFEDIESAKVRAFEVVENRRAKAEAQLPDDRSLVFSES
jgi:hypothetical protein